MSGQLSIPTIVRFADFELNVEQRTLTHQGHKIRLQEQPLRLLALLVARPGTIVTREEIQAHLWPRNTYVEFDKSLRVAVSKVRDALCDPANQPSFVETVPRLGYRFVAEVTVVSSTPAQEQDTENLAVVAPPTIAAVEPAPQLAPVPGVDQILPGSQAIPVKSSFHRLPRWALFAVVVLAAGLTFFVGAGLHKMPKSTLAVQPAPRRSVAVIGLRNLNGATEDRWLSTALAEMLSTELSSSDRIRVVSAEEIARVGLSEPPPNAPSQESIARYARQLGADMIVVGSYTLSPGSDKAASSKLRLDLRVENFSSDVPPIALVETGSTGDLFSIVSATGSELRQRLGLGERSADAASAVRRTLPQSPTAAQFYAEGLNRLRLFDPMAAKGLLQRAVQIEPGHAGSHLALSQTWSILGYETEARSEAARALGLTVGLPREEMLSMQGEVAILSHDWPRAIDVFRSLVTFYPDDIDYGLSLVHAQDVGSHNPDALATVQGLRHQGLSPAAEARIDLAEAGTDLPLGKFQQAVETADRAIQIGAQLDQKLVCAQGLWIKASALERLGKSAESLAASAEAQKLYRTAGDNRGLGVATLMSGDVLYDGKKTAEAREMFQSALDLFREGGYLRYVGATLERIGNTYYDEGGLPDSRKFYQQALEAYRELHWDAGIASAVGNIANVQDTEGNLPGALQSNADALALFERTGLKRGAASSLVNMGNIEIERGDIAAAADDFSRAAKIDREIGYTRGLTFALIGQGDVLLARNEIGAANQTYEQAFQTMKGMDEPNLILEVEFSLGNASLLAGDPHQAITHLQPAVDMALKGNNHGMAAVSLACLARSLLAEERIADAFSAANRAIAESKAQFSPQLRVIAELALARVQMAEGNRVAAREQLLSLLQTAQRDGYRPLAMEARILLARTEPDLYARRSQLETLAREASQHGWKLAASDARKPRA
ncbi:MAG TPA: winged helix-turn-helix domain-containing protein [Candidatus Angelobacter sp.]|nr:winged helix-turn-helix domain-containing protein [Candidatus Angelobacter sp.]